ncbi:MAG TPA: ABC transporter ATP-binding protein [Mycobacteriales bacterium]|nr:ABC transporter ATP-binding protein [Mycobacteriales bacterium]
MTMLLSIEGLRVAYGRIEALRGIDLAVEEGEIVALLGANGAGKTTTLRTISGLLSPIAGSISFDGRRIDGARSDQIVAAGIGHVPEGRRIFPRMSVLENLQMGAYHRGRASREDIERAFTLFPVLQERQSQSGGNLSGGEQQMLAICRALMGQPRLLLLDEPSMGLAPMVVARIFETIREINAQGTTILLVEQNAAQALRLAGRGYVLETGSIALADRSKALLADDRVRSAYLGESVA